MFLTKCSFLILYVSRAICYVVDSPFGRHSLTKKLEVREIKSIVQHHITVKWWIWFWSKISQWYWQVQTVLHLTTTRSLCEPPGTPTGAVSLFMYRFLWREGAHTIQNWKWHPTLHLLVLRDEESKYVPKCFSITGKRNSRIVVTKERTGRVLPQS